MIRLTGLVGLKPLTTEEKWIQQAIKKPGALKKQLGVSPDEPIPAGKLKAAAKKGGKLGKRARLAITLKKLREAEGLSDEERTHLDEMINELEMVPRPFIAPDMNKDGVVDSKDQEMRHRRMQSLQEIENTHSHIDDTEDEIDDHEGEMAKSSLLALHKQAGELYNMLGDNEQLEGWVQAKITKAADYINAVYNNMQYEKSKPTAVGNGDGTPADKMPDSMMEEAGYLGELKEGINDDPEIKHLERQINDINRGRSPADPKHPNLSNATRIFRLNRQINRRRQMLARPTTGDVEETQYTLEELMGMLKEAGYSLHENVTTSAVTESAEEATLTEKAPEGWEATVKRMKQHKEIDNPWALAHWMKSKGYQPKKRKSKKKSE